MVLLLQVVLVGQAVGEKRLRPFIHSIVGFTQMGALPTCWIHVGRLAGSPT